MEEEEDDEYECWDAFADIPEGGDATMEGGREEDGDGFKVVQTKRGARIVRGKRARLLPRTHLRANRQRKRLHLQKDRSHQELKRVPEKAGETSPGERTKSAGL